MLFNGTWRNLCEGSLLTILIALTGGPILAADLRVEVADISQTGDLYVYIVTEDHMKTPGTGVRWSVVETCDYDCRDGCEIAIVFHALAADEYGVRTFSDTNGKGRLDRGLFGPTEPWALSWNDTARGRMPSSFDEISFGLARDTTVRLALK